MHHHNQAVHQAHHGHHAHVVHQLVYHQDHQHHQVEDRLSNVRLLYIHNASSYLSFWQLWIVHHKLDSTIEYEVSNNGFLKSISQQFKKQFFTLRIGTHDQQNLNFTFSHTVRLLKL